MRWWVATSGTKMLRERGVLITRVPGHFLLFAWVSDPPTAAARDVYRWWAEVEAPSTGTKGSDEGVGIRITQLFTLSGLSNHAVSCPFFEGATCRSERAVSCCWRLVFPQGCCYCVTWFKRTCSSCLLLDQTHSCDRTAGRAPWTDWEQLGPALHLGGSLSACCAALQFCCGLRKENLNAQLCCCFSPDSETHDMWTLSKLIGGQFM